MSRLALLSACILVAACASDPVTGRLKPSIRTITPEEEREIGRAVAPRLEAQFNAVLADAEASRVLGELVTELVELSPRREELDFTFKILNSSIPNAVALPGGHVYITRGLLENIESEAEFVSVMGHEIGHVDHRHAAEVPWSQVLLSVPTLPFTLLGSLIPGTDALTGSAAGIVNTPANVAGLGFNRSQELQADQRGLTLAAKLGYDPRDFRRVFDMFERLESNAPDNTFALLRTHPTNPDRIKAIEATLRRDFPEVSDQTFREGRPDFADVLEAIHSRSASYATFDAALGLLGDGTDEEGRQQARELIDRALEIHTDPLFLIMRAEISQMEADFEGALVDLLTAHELYEEETPGDGHWKPPFYLGLFALQNDDWETSLPLLRTAAERQPDLGLIYHQIGRAEELADDAEAARAAYEHALELGLEASLEADGKARLKALPRP